MSKLISLTIKGIRLFNPEPKEEYKQTINFDNNIILITGPNGSGKTTIFESLQYALTGLCRKKSAGIGFFYDINVLGKKDYMAECRLKFQAVDGKIYEIVRKTKISKSGKKSKLKTQESKILDEHQKEVYSKPDTVEQQIPRLLGIPKAILENVIFCQQTDQCWPIELNDKDLKLRFDTIFGSDNYESAIGQIKELKKNKDKELVQLQKEEINYNKDYEQKVKNEEDLLKKTREINEIEQEKKEIDVDLTRLHQIADNIEEKQGKIKDLENVISQKEGQLKIIKESIDSFEMNHERVQMTISSCEDLKASLESELQSNRETINLAKSQIEMKKHDYERVKREITERTQKLKDLKSKSENFNFEKTNFEKLISDFKNNYGTDDYQEYYKKIESENSSKTENLKKLKRDIQNLENDFKNEQEKQREEVDEHNRQLTEVKTELKSYDEQLNKLEDYSQEGYENLIKETQLAKDKLDAELRSDDSYDKISSKINEINNENKNINKSLTEKKEIIKKLESQRSINNQINDNEQKISKNKKEIKSKINEIKELIHEEIDEENFSKIIKEKQKSLNNEENSIRVETDKEKTKYEKSQIELDSKEKSLENKNKTKNDIESDLIENLGSTDFENEYKKYKNEQENLQKLISLDTKSQSIYEEFVSESRSESCQCPLCKRKFKDNSERDEFIKNELEKVLKDLPSKIASNEEKLRKVSEKIESIENLRDKHFIYQQVLEDIPKLEEEIDTLKSKRDQNFEEYQQIKQNYDEIRSKKEKFEHEVIPKKNDVERLISYVSKYESENDNLRSKLNKDLPNLSVIEEEKRILEDKSQNLQTEQANLMKKLTEASDRKSKLQSRYNEVNNKLNDYKSKFDDKNKIKEKRQKRGIKKRDIENKLIEIERINKEMNEANAQNLESIKKATNELQLDVDKLNNDFIKIKNDFEKISKSKETISKYSVDETNRKIYELEKTIKENEDSLQQLDENLKKWEKKQEADQQNMDEIKIKLEENNLVHDYLQKVQKYKEIEHEKEELLRELSGFANIDDLKNIDRIKQEILNKEKRSSELQGSYSHLDKELKDLSKILNNRYKDTNNNLTEIRLKIAATEMTIKDLTKFAEQLNNSIMEYHQRKVLEINELLKAFWEKSYQSMDIENISIVAHSSTENNESKSGRISYDYKVVMFKSGQEVEMSGRCSEGQKVLASLIIRMALAKAFGCSILALDEPTTNLDSDHMSNFAFLLSNDFKTMLENQQLLLITHSGDFVDKVSTDSDIQHFYQLEIESIDGHSFSCIHQKDSKYLQMDQ
ncbi:hypothetical protein TVAG_332600 [Trichomonas vaginalis G3]|uniref:Zinc-hook domain-containing protein n=1 Tax=Trichomonas vaginalis (strain ATCC PRA-98 / G3) TaxID=412133 RepID=A2FAD3_TRIV3|nr:Rad50 family [Trichomonas vaginalis G3]EAX98150.1 hypothetical protein TVAG_332600 [Trichomonas vaginalis G3]KAI5484866.1 Rad50 family [Trichomonas vaginalis G3]|eukprot:XP_001311080.1 hypothetical protein [Trichomonas vaginalis G3]